MIIIMTLLLLLHFPPEKAATVRGLHHSHLIASMTLSSTAVPVSLPASPIATAVSDTNSTTVVLSAEVGVVLTDGGSDGGLYL